MARPRTGPSKRMTISVPYEDIKAVEAYVAHYKQIKISYSAQLVSFMVRELDKIKELR